MASIFDASITDSLFGAVVARVNGLETLANAALQRGIDAFMQKNYEKAVSEFKRSVGIGRNSSFAADAAQYLAMSYIQLEDIDSAEKAYQTAYEIDPSRDDIRTKLGNLFFSQKKYEDARKEYAEAVRLNPSTVNRFSLGQAYIELGRFGDAEAQFNDIIRLAPQDPGGFMGLGQAYSRQGKHEQAIAQYQEAIDRDPELYAAYEQMGYVYADMGEMENAQEMVDFLEEAEQYAAGDTLSRYMYKVDPPKMVFGHSSSSFLYGMGKGTPVSALSAYLETADASKTFTMTIQFDKAMDRESVENTANWLISRAAGQGPGQSYNYGLRISDKEAKINPIPDIVTYDAENLTATVYFRIKQNSLANATIDPAHIEFKFTGTDIYGLKMNPKFDQFTGFTGVA